MAARESEIQELRTQLQTSRWQLHDGIQQLESRFNVPRRIRTQLAEHPMKWVVVSVAVGLVAMTVLPHVLRGAGKPMVKALLAPTLRAATMFALPFLTTHLKAMALPRVG